MTMWCRFVHMHAHSHYVSSPVMIGHVISHAFEEVVLAYACPTFRVCNHPAKERACTLIYFPVHNFKLSFQRLRFYFLPCLISIRIIFPCPCFVHIVSILFQVPETFLQNWYHITAFKFFYVSHIKPTPFLFCAFSITHLSVKV